MVYLQRAAQRPARAEPPRAAPLTAPAAGPSAAQSGAMRFEYVLDAAARREPFRVVAMWNDGEHTWFRSPATASAARVEYERVDAEEILDTSSPACVASLRALQLI